MSLEELLDYAVEAPTRKPQSLSRVPGSVTVITYDQIQASSAQPIPELLRRVPGINVRWKPMVKTIDIRGFDSALSNQTRATCCGPTPQNLKV